MFYGKGYLILKKLKYYSDNHQRTDIEKLSEGGKVQYKRNILILFNMKIFVL